jgi:phosphatidylserine/phosphatidylglycerophosphate/cardiolipin synthase-like enzyme
VRSPEPRNAARLLGRLDDWAGAGIERAVVAHHRRRLRRVGARPLDGPAGGWAAGPPPPRDGNAVDVLVDGADALAAIAEAIEHARESVWLAGWFFSPDLRLRRDDPRTLRELLADTAKRADVRLLVWAGAPLPLFHPDRGEVREMRRAFADGARLTCALDDHERPMHCHHEKLVIVDGELAFVGGIDLTSYGGDRLDTSDHPARGAIGWHDAAARLRGPAVADVAAHFRLRWLAVTGEALPETPAPGPLGDIELQVVRTVPERIYDELPRGDFAILDSYVRALRSARRLVYLENQFLWSPEIVDVLAEKLRNPPDDRFRLVVVLPMKPNNGRDDTRGQLAQLARADEHADRFLACTLHQRGAGGRPVYVHAKIGIVDDEWLTIGSANLNEHSLFNDTEMNLAIRNPELARATRLRLWSEHLELDEAELGGDPARIVDELWQQHAGEQLERFRAGAPLTHRLLALPHVSRRINALRGPIDGLLVDG